MAAFEWATTEGGDAPTFVKVSQTSDVEIEVVTWNNIGGEDAAMRVQLEPSTMTALAKAWLSFIGASGN